MTFDRLLDPWILWAVLSALFLLYLLPLAVIHPLARWWLNYWHERGAATQRDYYRCNGPHCGRIITWRQIHQGGCACKWTKVSPAVLSLREKAMLLYLPWLVVDYKPAIRAALWKARS